MGARTLLCLLLVPGIFANPFSRYDNSVRFQTQCSTQCTGSSKFEYEQGKTYHYKYEVLTVSDIHEASEGQARLEASADAYIHVLSKCELALTLSGVNVKRSEPNSDILKDVTTYEYKSALENYVLRFSFQDGRVEEICPSDDEEPFAINFKRGILSAFQNSMSQHDRPENLNEIDVTGNCPTVYTISQRGTRSMQISKTKDLLGCEDRHYYRTSLQSTPFHTPRTIKSLPLLKGSHRCTQTISKTSGHITQSLCLESLVFRPFSRQQAGARTETTQKLEHIKTTDQPNIQKDGVFRKSSLIYEHTKKKVDMDQLLWAAKDKLNELCRASVEDISADVPALFADFVYLMRGLDSRDIMDVWERVERGTVCANNHDRALKFILDSLPMVGTSSSVEVMTEMLLANKVTGAEADFWITSFTFIQDPDKFMIKQIKRLLLSETYRQKSLLPVTSLINNFCHMQADCALVTDVGDVIDILNDILGSNCENDDKDLMLTTLRATGNIGHADQLAPVLEKCFSRSTNDMNTRVMAAQAFRGVTCNVKRNALLDLFMNEGEDSELRIAAYLGLMKCPTTPILRQIQISLASEPVNQVGSFVWTHLTNLMETSSPHKQALREILEDQKLKKEFDLDQRKYSRNYELSYFSEKFGTGAMAESNLIWSSSSFLPRSLMVNLTVDVLGHSVNLLEAGARTQGMERLIMNYFASDKIPDKNTKSGNFNNPSKCVKKTKMNMMNEKHGVSEDEMSASFYLRMFGNDLDFKHYSEKDIKDMRKKITSKNILASLIKGEKISFSHSAMFLDSTVSVPTIGGMALELSVNGTASVELKASGKMNFVSKAVNKMEMLFNMRPSGAVQLAGLMTLNAGVSKTGLRMVTTLHSSTALSANVDLINGQVLSASLDTPKDTLEVLDVKSEFFVLHDEAEEKQEMRKFETVSQKKCSPDSLLKAFGYEACADISYVDASAHKDAPYFPLTGPTSVSLVIKKKDAPRGFKLTSKYVRNDNTFNAHISVDTPGSKVDRNVAIGYFVDTKDKSLEMELTSPWKSILLKGSAVEKEKTKSILVTVINDGREHTFEIRMDKERKADKTIMTPSIRLVRPADSILVKFVPRFPEKFAVDGRLEVNDEITEFSGEVNISSGIRPDPIRLQASYINQWRQKSLSGSVTLNKRTFAATVQALIDYPGKRRIPSRIQPTILITKPGSRLFLLNGNIDYKEGKLLKTDLMVKMEGTLKKPVKLNVKINGNSKKDSNFKGSGKLFSEFAVIKSRGFMSFGFLDSSKKNSAVISSKITTNYFLPIVKTKALKKNTVILNLKINDRSTPSSKRYYGTLNLDSKKYQEASFLTTMEIAHKATFTKSMFTFRKDPKAKNLKDKKNELRVGASVDHKITKQGAKINYDLQAIYPIKQIDYQWKGKHEHTLGKLFSFETYNMFVLAKGKTVELRLNGDNMSKKQLEAYGIMELNYPSFTIGMKKFDSQSFKLTTIIKQTPNKEFIHTVNIKTKEGDKHVMVTTFRKSKNNNFNMKSEVDIDGKYKSKLTLAAWKEDAKVDASLLYEKDNQMYKGQITSDGQGNKYRNINLDVIYPERRIMAEAESGWKDGKNILNGHCSWDADRDISKKVEVNVYTRMDVEENMNRKNEIEYGFKVTTPFEDHTIYQLDRIIKSGPERVYEEYKYIYGKPENEFSYKYSFLLPKSFSRIEMMAQIKTPFEKLRNFHSEIQHKYDGTKYLSSLLTGKYNEHEMSVTTKITNRGDLVRNMFESSLKITSSFPKVKTVTLELTHNDDGKAYYSNMVYESNGKTYRIDLNADYFRIHWQVKMSGDLVITIPDKDPVTIKLRHDNTLTNMDSSISGNWGNNNEAKLILAAKFNKAEKDYSFDITFTSPLDEARSFVLKSHHNEMNGKEGSFFYQRNFYEKNQNLGATYTYKYTDTELAFEGVDVQCTYSGLIKFERFPYSLFVKYSDKGPDGGEYLLDASVDESHNGWTTDMRLLTPHEEARNVDVNGHLKKIDGAWTLDGTISLDVRKNIKLDFTLDTDKWTKMECQIKSPFEEMTFMKFGFLRKEGKDTHNSTAFIEIQPVFNMVKMDNYLSQKPNLHSEFSLEIPDLDFKQIKIIANNVRQRRGVKTDVNIKYHPSKEIDLKFKARYNQNKFPEKTKVTLDFSSPFKELRTLNLKTDIDKDNEKWIANLNLKTSNKKLKSLDATYKLESTETAFSSDLLINYPTLKPMHSGIEANWGETQGATLTLDFPEIGRNVLGFKRKSVSWLDFQNKIFAEYEGNTLDVDIGFKHDELLTNAWMTYEFPGADQSFIKTNVYRQGNSYMDFDVGYFLQIGKNSPEYNTSAQFSYTEVKTALGLTFITPHTMPFSYLLTSTFSNGGREGKAYLMVGKDYLVDLYEKLEATKNSLQYENKFNYLFEGEGHSSHQNLFAKWTDLGEESKYNSYFDDKHIQLEFEHKNAKANGNNKETLDIMLYTPYENFNDVGLQAVLFMEDTKYNGKCTIEYMDDKEAELTFDLTQQSAQQLTFDSTLTIPETDFRQNTLKYKQITRRDKFIADAKLFLGNGEKARTKFEFKNTEEFIITVTGPIQDFEKMTVTGKYNEKQQELNGDIQLKLKLHPKPANLEFSVLLNNEPVQMNFKLQTPYENFKNAELTILHIGKDWRKFTTKSELTSEAIGNVNSVTSFSYNSENEMEGKATLTSSVEKMENLKFGFSTKKVQDDQRSHLELGWNEEEEIVVDSSFALNKVGLRTIFKTDLEMSTPFEEIKSAKLKFSHENGKRKVDQEITIAHNGRTYLDSTLSYKSGQRHIGTLDMRHPRPMAFELEAEAGDQAFDGRLKLNWDKHSPESLFEFVTKMSDKSTDTNLDKTFSFKVIHPVRLMGMDCQIKSAEKEVLSSGHVTWDERKGKTFSYDIGYSDRSTKYSQMYDGHVKLGVPQRSIKVEGAHRDTGSSKTLSSSIFWDADRDETKKVVLSTTTERQDRMERVSLNLNLPYINKQMNMGISRKVGYGSSILESDAEISYSSDPRKNILITTKIDNIEMDIEDRGNYNYTVAVGFVHQITGLDIKWESHLAQVNEISSTGSRVSYVTANDDKKVLAFWSQLNSDKQRAEMTIITPLKTLALIGDIDNESHLRSMTFQALEDGTEALKVLGTTDPRRQNMEFEIHYDRDNANKMLSVSGSFVDDSALEINVVSQDGHKRISESQIAVTLNSSEILHTRILWRPELFKDIQTFMSTEAAVMSHTASEAFSQTSMAVGAEVTNKYARVSQELRDEMKQVFELMEKEMDRFSTQLEALRTAYRRFYQNNNLGIRAAGETINKAFAGFSVTIQNLVKQYRAYYTGITKAINKWLNDLRTYPIMQKYLAVSQAFIDALKESRIVIEETLEDITKEIKTFSEASYKMYSGLQRSIDRKLNSYNRLSHELPMYKQMIAQRQFLPGMAKQKIPMWLETYEKMYLGFQEMLQDQYDDLMSRREFRELYAIGAEVHQQFMYYNLERNIESALERVVSLSKNLILMELMKMKESLFNMEKSRLIVYDPERGELQFEIHLPLEMKSLTEPPKMKIQALSQLRSWVMDKAPKANYSVWDTYYSYVPSLKPSSWVPPFKASGYVIGSQHILTFDKTHYDFMSTCSHVLARDMVHDNFSVVLNYNRNQRLKKIRSICLHFEDSLSMEISNDYELTVNGKETEMPYYSEIVSAIREGDMITVKYTGGLMVVCNPQLDLYKVTLSGWYHGRTAGLLGIYDNEKKNDETLSDRTGDFEVNRRTCRTSSNMNLAVSPDPDNDKDNICVQLFEENSSKYRPCFKQVDPSQFLQICQRYMGEMSSEDAVYKATEQYRFVCRDQGVYIGPMDEYVPCNKEKPFIVDGKDPLYQSADVLFVVQDTKCNQWVSASLGTVVTETNKALDTAGMKDNRYGLLGVEPMNPTVHTMNGHHFGKAPDVLRAIETLKFKDEDSRVYLSNAVRMAMKYPFRPGVAKVMFIAPCSTCDVGFMERNLDSALKNNGFRVHVLRQLASSMEAVNINSNRPSSIAVSYFNRPSDYCETLASTTNGTVFDNIYLRQGKGRAQRQFIESLAQNIGWNTRLPTCQKCTCNAETGLTECQLCDTNSILSYIPIRPPSLPEVIGTLHDFEHSMMSYMNK